MTIDRRTLLSCAARLAALAPLFSLGHTLAAGTSEIESANAQAHDAHERLSSVAGLKMHGHEHVAMLLYPKFTALDLGGAKLDTQ